MMLYVIHQYSLRKRLVIVLIGFVLVPVVGGFAIYNRIASRVISEQLTRSNQATALQAALNVDRGLGIMVSAIALVAENPAISRYIDTPVPRSFLVTRDAIAALRQVTIAGFLYPLDVLVVTEADTIGTLSNLPVVNERARSSTWYRRAVAEPDVIHWTIELPPSSGRETGGSDEVAVAARALGGRRQGPRAVVAVMLDRDFLSRDLPGDLRVSDGAIQADREHVAPLENGWLLTRTVPLPTVPPELIAVQRLAMLIVAAVAISVSALIIVNVLSETRSLNELQAGLRAAGQGELSTRITVIRRDEIGLVAQQFNTMLDEIQDLVRRVGEEHKMAAEARLAHLRSQMSPHFLLNALNSIRITAELSGAPNAAALTSSLARMLEPGLYAGKGSWTVSDELDLLESYLKLEDARSGDQWACDVRAADSVKAARCPVYGIQILVENAIKHGLSGDRLEPMTIGVDVTERDSVIVARVTDDGAGFPDSWDTTVHEPATHVGLSNVHERVRSTYGPPYGVTTARNEPHGAVVVLTFPHLESRL